MDRRNGAFKDEAVEQSCLPAKNELRGGKREAEHCLQSATYKLMEQRKLISTLMAHMDGRGVVWMWSKVLKRGAKNIQHQGFAGRHRPNY